MKLTKNSTGFASLLLVFFVVVLLALAGGFYAVKGGLIDMPGLNQTLVSKTGEQPAKNNVTSVRRVEFIYKVKAVTDQTITLTGEMGDFRLPNDPLAVSVYKGPTTASPKMGLSQLKVGDKVNVEFIPGKSASLYMLGV